MRRIVALLVVFFACSSLGACYGGDALSSWDLAQMSVNGALALGGEVGGSGGSSPGTAPVTADQCVTMTSGSASDHLQCRKITNDLRDQCDQTGAATAGGIKCSVIRERAVELHAATWRTESYWPDNS